MAIAVEQWSDGYPAFLATLGGQWVGGGSTGEFAPAQIGFGGGVKVELLQPGKFEDGFVRRSLKKNGCGAHHLTFIVPRLADFEAVATRYGLPVLGAFLEVPERPEIFLHPKGNGFGTLLQAIEFNDLHPDPSPPQGLPKSGPRIYNLSWVAVRVVHLRKAAEFLVEATGATINHAESGPRSVLLEWDGGRHLLLLDASGDDTGIDHIAFHLKDRTPPSPKPALYEAGGGSTFDAPGVRIIVCR